MPRQLLLENVSCSRCGGSGEYSYCQSYGTRCFKCHGDGRTLTKRGAAAQRWLYKQKCKLGREVQVGEIILYEGIPGYSRSYWAKVTEVAEGGTITAVGIKNGESVCLQSWGEMTVRIAQSKERLAELRVAVLAYQATLTKAGTVRKRKAVKAAAPVQEAA